MRDPLSSTIHKPTPRKKSRATLLIIAAVAIAALVLAALTARQPEIAQSEEIEVEILVTEPDQPAPQAPPTPPQTAP